MRDKALKKIVESLLSMPPKGKENKKEGAMVMIEIEKKKKSDKESD